MPKMKRARIVKFSLDELAGVDAGAQAEAGAVILKRKDGRTAPVATMKRSAITTAMLGHTHLVSGIDDMQSGCTSSERSEPFTGDGYSYHSHPWVRTDDGSIVLGEANGHTHEIALKAADATAAAAKHAQAKSTPSIETSKVNTMTTKIVVLSEAQGAHYSKLTGADAEAFAAKSSLERDADVAKVRDADPVIYTGDVTKTAVRRSDGPLALQLAQQNESNAIAAKNALAMAETEKAARELTELTKRAADTIGNLAGTNEAHVDVLRAVESITDTAKRDSAVATLKAANALMAKAGVAKGAGGIGDPVPDSLEGQVEELAKKIATEQKVDIAKARALVFDTPEGIALYGQIEKRKRTGASA